MICLNNNIKYNFKNGLISLGGFLGFIFDFVVDVGCFFCLFLYEVDSVLCLMWYFMIIYVKFIMLIL